MRAAFIAEGKSERALIGVLEQLCRRAGVDEVEIEWAQDLLVHFDRLGKQLGPRIQTLLTHDPDFDLLFIHRDADQAGLEARRAEIDEALASCPGSPGCVRVIPVRETEAWLLADPRPLRDVVGNPGRSNDLGLPRKPAQIEACSDPKQALRDSLARASLSSRKHKLKTLTNTQFGEFRARLLEQLDIDGPVTKLDSWQRLLEELESACAWLAQRELPD
ncbi:hypothetical protein DB30_00716 [Enhygromyxa salina]|uniref:DUF4276 domain-containing protein n=1 Tax=Enhygromyxa salina TaxID=215803 RepID=A0A0C2D5H8_9BACT|nr:DUF4276 family protein [Enhygromyxa salina]KIG18431.1 hypothetical protein DB30_00716 [Enhygromyxa salina]